MRFAKPRATGRRRRKNAAGFLLAVLLVACATAPLSEPPRDAPHFQNGRFLNPWEPFNVPYGELIKSIFRPNRFDGQDFGPVPRADNADEAYRNTPGPALTWIGHATFAIREGDDVILTDPHFTEKALMVRRKTPPGISLDAIGQPLLAVVSHNHYDHLDEATVMALPAETVWIVPLGLAPWFRERGRMRVVELDWWGSTEVEGWRVHCVPVQHWSRRFGQATNATLWCGFILDSPTARYFFAGDTGYFDGFRTIARRFPGIDLAMLPIGAYYPENFLRYQHMGPADALRAFADLKARHFVPMHWGTFKLSLEPLAEPPVQLRTLAAEQAYSDQQVRIMALGETWRWAGRGLAPDDG